MRLWHKDLIPYLPCKQLIGQWRECCLIAKNIAEQGTPNHLLVNRIMDYPLSHFGTYCDLICTEMIQRGYCVTDKSLYTIQSLMGSNDYATVSSDVMFKDWHNQNYITQCFFNLQEKYQCRGLTEDEYEKLLSCPSVKRIFGK